MPNTAILLIECPDRVGIVATVADFLFRHRGNILHADEHQDASLNLFLTRVEWDLEGCQLPPEEFAARFAPIAEEFKMRWQLRLSTSRPRVAIFVSRQLHCLLDLLYRHQIGELRCELCAVVGNHLDGQRLAEFYKVPFHHVPVDPAHKPEAERRQLQILEASRVELVVLARYMQILTPEFVDRYPARIINVHHSFLPAFAGAKPYQQAFDRGVKLIGASAHYVTAELDEGPIIEQDVARVSHRDQVEDLTQKGRDLERLVLSRAVRWHLEHRILVYGRKTVVFD